VASFLRSVFQSSSAKVRILVTTSLSNELKCLELLDASAMSYITDPDQESQESSDVGAQHRFVLPSELWILIFKLAAGEPFSAFDTSPLPIMSSEHRAWTHIGPPRPNNPFLSETSRAIYQDYMDRVRLRINLVLVCEYWRTLAISLLYEYVLLRHRHASVSFSQVMTAHTTSLELPGTPADGYSPHISRYVKRLDIHINWTQWNSFRLNKAPAFASSFQHCNNLDVLVSTTDGSQYADEVEVMVFEVLIKHNPLLRYIKRSRRVLTSTQMVRSFNAIEVLSLAISSTDIQIPSESNSELSLPRLHTLEIRVIDSNVHQFRLVWLSNWHLPALRRLHLPHDLVETEPKNDFVTFIKAFGHTLHCIDFDYIAVTTASSGQSLAIAHCPSLREISLRASVLKDTLFTLPNLCGVKLLFDDRRDLDGLNVRLCTLWERSQQLKLIRFLNFSEREFPYFDNVDWKMLWEEKDAQTWAALIRQWARNGVRMECETGELLEPPHFQVCSQ
jgi:hypothetical protein